MPTIGKHRSNVRKNTYSFSYQSHVIYYLKNDETKALIVIGVLHKNSIPQKHLIQLTPVKNRFCGKLER